MDKKQLLNDRLGAIGRSLADSGTALALLGLGSVGLDLARLDDYSDLDFFAIVEPGHKMRYIDRLDWLERIHPIDYCFRNTHDGYKLMYSDGVFCEFAVFEPHELQHIPFPHGRLVWQRADFNADCCRPMHGSAQEPSTDVGWLVGEAVTNLYVGLCRYRRGERLSALTFIQNYAFQRILDLNGLIATAQSGGRDPFVRERRFEGRYPEMAELLSDMLTGYAGIVDSARAMVAYLDRHFGVPPKMKQEIIRLCAAEPIYPASVNVRREAVAAVV